MYLGVVVVVPAVSQNICQQSWIQAVNRLQTQNKYFTSESVFEIECARIVECSTQLIVWKIWACPPGNGTKNKSPLQADIGKHSEKFGNLEWMWNFKVTAAGWYWKIFCKFLCVALESLPYWNDRWFRHVCVCVRHYSNFSTENPLKSLPILHRHT